MFGSIGGILLIGIIGFVIYYFFKKRKKGKETAHIVSNRRNKDEVWKSIKQFLKDNDEYGKEIIDSYVVKRNHVDYIDPNASKTEKLNKKAEIKIRDFQKKQLRLQAKAQNKKYYPAKVQDLFVVTFITRDTKSHALDQPRSIECEVINQKVSKKEWDRKILINGELNYNEEMEWIAPIKAAEKIKTAKANEKARTQNAKKAARDAEKLKKEREKAIKDAEKLKVEQEKQQQKNAKQKV